MTIDDLFLQTQVQIRKQIAKKYKHYDDIDDILQDIYLYFKEREDRMSFETKEQFVSYAMKIALTEIKAIDKHSALHSSYAGNNNTEVDLENMSYDLEEATDRVDLGELAYNKIKELDFIEEAIIKSKLYHKVSYTELAKQLGISRSKVYNIHIAALKKLKNLIC